MNEVPAHIKASMPWTYVVHPNGYIQTVDKDNKEVPILDMLEVACYASRVISTQ
jgi:hypothetical protein